MATTDCLTTATTSAILGSGMLSVLASGAVQPGLSGWGGKAGAGAGVGAGAGLGGIISI